MKASYSTRVSPKRLKSYVVRLVGRKGRKRSFDLDLIVHDHIKPLFLAFDGAGDTAYPGADNDYLERRGWVVAGHVEKRGSGEGDGVVFRLGSGANCRVPWIVGFADRFGKYICGPGVAIGQISMTDSDRHARYLNLFDITMPYRYFVISRDLVPLDSCFHTTLS